MSRDVQARQDVAEFTRQISANARDATAYNNRAFSYFDMGQMQDALTDFTSAIAL